MQIICTQSYGFKYSYPILIIICSWMLVSCLGHPFFMVLGSILSFCKGFCWRILIPTERVVWYRELYGKKDFYQRTVIGNSVATNLTVEAPPGTCAFCIWLFSLAIRHSCLMQLCSQWFDAEWPSASVRTLSGLV